MADRQEGVALRVEPRQRREPRFGRGPRSWGGTERGRLLALEAPQAAPFIPRCNIGGLSLRRGNRIPLWLELHALPRSALNGAATLKQDFLDRLTN